MPDDTRGSCALSMCGLEFSSAEIDHAARSGGLLSIELELSRACNLHCVYCYANAGSKDGNELSLEEVMDAIEQARALGARKVVVLGGGEPLLYPEIRRVLDYLSEKRLVL